MLLNHFRISYRNLTRNKGYSAITIAGLAIGLCVALFTGLYVADELGYDRFNQKADRIFRINSDITFAGQTSRGAVSPTPMGAAMQRDFPEIEAAARLGKYGSQVVKSSRLAAREEHILYADSTVFDLFTLPLTAGNPQSALAGPGSVVISEKMALKYFGTRNAIGSNLSFDNGDSRRVTGVMREIPRQSHFQADFLLPLYETPDAKANKWGNHIFNTYVLLRPGTTPAAVGAKFENLMQTYLDPALRQYFQTTLADARKAGNNYAYSLMPLSDIHLHSDREGELSVNGSVSSVYIFTLTGAFILVIAIFNFINLTTARAAKRAREVGVRKVLGSDRLGLVIQFLSESTLTTALALLTSLVLTQIGMPYFNNLAGKQLSLSGILDLKSMLFIIAGAFLVALVAGAYPALYLSSFRSVAAMKGGRLLAGGRQGLRSSLVVFQFGLSMLLIIGTLVMKQQMQFIRNGKLGFDKEQVVIVKTGHTPSREVITFKDELLGSSLVKSGSVSGFLPVNSRRWNDMWYPERAADQKYAVRMQEWIVDPDYIPTLGLALRSGRNFSKSSQADQAGVVINESAARQFGYDNPIGKTIHKSGGEQLTIIGVVKDFHYESLRTKVEPLALIINTTAVGSNLEPYFLEAVTLRLRGSDIPAALAAIKSKWESLMPGRPFEYSFMSEDFDAMYRSELRAGELFTVLAALAILIACIGLFGLSAFAAEQRNKEIGVRKVLGASVAGIVALLSRHFLKPIALAVLLASPAGWYLMDKWLQGFAYRIEIHWWIFALAGLLALGIALLTVSFQSIRAALTDPVRSLRSE